MYQILSSNSAGALCFEVNEFLKQNLDWFLLGGPYSDGQFHYQAFYKKEKRQLLNG